MLVLYALHTLTGFQVFLQQWPKLLLPVLHRDEGTHSPPRVLYSRNLQSSFPKESIEHFVVFFKIDDHMLIFRSIPRHWQEQLHGPKA